MTMWAVLALALSATTPQVGGEALQLEAICQGGFEVLLDGPAPLRLSSCPTGDRCTSRVNGPSGEIAEVHVDGEQVTVTLAGRDVTQLSAGHADELETLLDSPSARAVPRVWEALLEIGMDPGSPGMACLSYQLPIFEIAIPGGAELPQGLCEDCQDPVGQCQGCCGSGCTSIHGCATTCTGSCDEHDRCWRNPLTRFSTGCTSALLRAINSIVRCRVRCGNCCCPDL